VVQSHKICHAIDRATTNYHLSGQMCIQYAQLRRLQETERRAT
jgi:hypothetical protein